MALDNITFATTTQLATAIRKRQVSATEVLQVHLAQIARHNPTLNAIVTLDAEVARGRARAADKALARGELWGPLHGIPFTLKDCHATAGMRTTSGHPPLATYVPAEDGAVAARLKAAGGILMGKTNVSELLVDIQSDNPLFGRTNNPWHLGRTPGGSSGGAAAAVAAGMTPFDIGSDIGGSIRLPAHFCGVFGLKVTENRISLAGHIPGLPGEPRSVRIMASAGPLARSLEDLALLYRITAGPDRHDVEVPPAPLDLAPQVQLQESRVALATTFPGFPVSSVIAGALRRMAGEIRPLCATVAEGALPPVDFHQQLTRARELTDMIVGAFQPFPGERVVTLPDYLQALHERDQAITAWEQFFEHWDVLICPASAVTAFPHCASESQLGVDEQLVDYWWANAHCKIFNYTGHPAVVLPYRVDDDGLPLGIQVVARRWDESRLLAIARALSQVTGAFRQPPGY